MGIIDGNGFYSGHAARSGFRTDREWRAWVTTLICRTGDAKNNGGHTANQDKQTAGKNAPNSIALGPTGSGDVQTHTGGDHNSITAVKRGKVAGDIARVSDIVRIGYTGAGSAMPNDATKKRPGPYGRRMQQQQI